MQPSSPYTFSSATKILTEAGVASVYVDEPLHDSSISVNHQFLLQLDKKRKGTAYRNRRAENHVRQFEALNSCHKSLQALMRQPDIAIRVRDDSYVVDIDINMLLEELHIQSKNDSATGVLITQDAQPTAGSMTSLLQSQGRLLPLTLRRHSARTTETRFPRGSRIQRLTTWTRT